MSQFVLITGQSLTISFNNRHVVFHIEKRTQSISRPFLALSFSFVAIRPHCTQKTSNKKNWLYYCFQQPLLKYITKHATISHSEQQLFNNLDL